MKFREWAPVVAMVSGGVFLLSTWTLWLLAIWSDEVTAEANLGLSGLLNLFVGVILIVVGGQAWLIVRERREKS